MIEQLKRSGALRSSACIRAFLAVDRAHFVPPSVKQQAYMDMPLRSSGGRLHLSAPHIYAAALEAFLPMTPGMSCLNIGSGTGYFSSLVSELIGLESVNDGVETSPRAVAHARKQCALLGKQKINFVEGNIFQLDVKMCMRYDRIYIGACADARATYLLSLLEVGGICVGPFQVGTSQQFQKIVRQSENNYQVQILAAVHFTLLALPAASTDIPSTDQSAGDREVRGLPGVPFTFCIRQKPWSLESNAAFPASFRCVVDMLRDPAARTGANGGRGLPQEIWLDILPWCSRYWFEKPTPRPAPLPHGVCGLVLRALGQSKAMMSIRRCFPCLNGSLHGIEDVHQGPREEHSRLLPLLEADRRQARAHNADGQDHPDEREDVQRVFSHWGARRRRRCCGMRRFVKRLAMSCGSSSAACCIILCSHWRLCRSHVTGIFARVFRPHAAP